MRTDEISVSGLLDKANASTTVFDHEVSHLVIDIDLPRVIVDDELRSTVVDLVSALLALQTLHRAASSLASKVTVWSSQSRFKFRRLAPIARLSKLSSIIPI